MANDASALRGNWSYPTSIRFGVGRIAELPDACKQLGFKQPLLVTDPGLAKLPMIQEAHRPQRGRGDSHRPLRRHQGQSGVEECGGRAQDLPRGRL